MKFLVIVYDRAYISAHCIGDVIDLFQARSKACSSDAVAKSSQPVRPAPKVHQKGGGKNGKGKKGKKGRHQQYDLIVTIDLVEYGLTEEIVAGESRWYLRLRSIDHFY